MREDHSYAPSRLHTDLELRRVLAHRKRVLALLRGSPQPAPAGSYGSEYAASLWALAQARTTFDKRTY